MHFARPRCAGKRLAVAAIAAAATLGSVTTAQSAEAERIDCSTVHPSLSGVLCHALMTRSAEMLGR